MNSWSSGAYRPSERYDAWEDILTRTFGSWNLEPCDRANYFSTVSTTSYDDLEIIDCTCDPCVADRTSSNILTDDHETFTAQFMLRGSERITFDGVQYLLKPGDIFVWDSTQEMRFEVEQQLHKVSMVLPLRKVRDWLPNSWYCLSRKASASTPMGRVLASYVRSLNTPAHETLDVNADALTEAATALLIGALDTGPAAGPRSQKAARLAAVKRYIGKHLSDPELSLLDIASANRISKRYLHWLFSGTNQTVSEYIMSERLAGCRRDLRNPLMRGRSVSEIAFSWGFVDPSHFGRRFRREFGTTPGQLRAQKRDTAAHADEISLR